MTCIAFRGLRGGVGTTSIVAGVAHALHELGGSVVAIDLCPDNLLKWHFGLGSGTHAGWHATSQAEQGWHVNAYAIAEALYLLPYGDAGCGAPQPPASGLWNERSRELAARYDWVLLDTPASLPEAEFQALGEHRVCVIEADAASAILLERSRGAAGSLLINRYDPSSRLQRDLRLVWTHRYPDRLLPTVAHRDEAMAQALACQLPVGAYLADSLGAQDLRSVATWLLARLGVPA